MLIGFILNIVFNLTLRFLYQLENRKRDKALEGKTQEEIEALKDESRLQGFDNVTDKYNVRWIPNVVKRGVDLRTGFLQIFDLI